MLSLYGVKETFAELQSGNMSIPPLFLSDAQVLRYLKWDTLIPAIESVMVGVVRERVVQPARLFMRVADKDGVVLAMPGYVKSDNQTDLLRDDSLAVKIVTSFTKNKDIGLPSIQATVLLYNSNTGQLKAIMEGTEITKWRTAAASLVATRHLFQRSSDSNLTLAVMGSGAQAYIHALGFATNFKLKQINIWNHRYPGAQALAAKLSKELSAMPQIWVMPHISAVESGREAVQSADIIVTATYSPVPVVKFEWLKPGNVHVNAVGAGQNHHSELDTELYARANIFFDSEASARNELKGLYQMVPANMRGEVGEYIEGKVRGDEKHRVSVFHSMGMASEDVITANLIYDAYKKEQTI